MLTGSTVNKISIPLEGRPDPIIIKFSGESQIRFDQPTDSRCWCRRATCGVEQQCGGSSCVNSKANWSSPIALHGTKDAVAHLSDEIELYFSVNGGQPQESIGSIIAGIHTRAFAESGPIDIKTMAAALNQVLIVQKGHSGIGLHRCFGTSPAIVGSGGLFMELRAI